MSNRKVVAYYVYNPDLDLRVPCEVCGTSCFMYSDTVTKRTKKAAFRLARGLGKGTLVFQRVSCRSGRLYERLYEIS